MNKPIVFGTGQENDKKKFNKKNFLKIIDYCVNQNILTFDTSDNYLNGKIEKLLGISLKKRNEKIKIINKFRLFNDIKILRKNLDNSLKNLNKDFIDIYMPHWPIFPYDKNLLADFAYESIQKKKIKEFGMSNFSLKMIKEFKKVYNMKLSLQFELNISNYFFYKNLVSYCEKKNINSFCYGISNNFPDQNKYIKIIKQKYNLSNYELSINWLSNFKLITPIIRSSNKFNIQKNIEIFNQKTFIKREPVFKNLLYKKIKLKTINKINSQSGYVYKNINEAKKNIFNIYPSPIDIAIEIKKNGLLKPFFFKRIDKNCFNLISGQARYWAYRITFPKAKTINGILVN